MKTLNQYLLEQSCNFRCGISLPFKRVPTNFSDISQVYNYSVPKDVGNSWKTASGSINFDENKAIMGAIGESLERYCGAVCQFDILPFSKLSKEKVINYDEFSLFSNRQYDDPDFLWLKPDSKKQYFGKVHSLYNNKEFYVPQELIGLGSRNENATIPSTSTGIAAHSNKIETIFSALLELLERDALTTYWLNSLGGREITLDEKYTKEVKEKKGQVFCFDISQDWNPFAVVIVCGYLLENNKKRISMGVACRENYKKAIEKAYLEWIQGCIFTGYYTEFHQGINLEKISDINSFDLHAIYYTLFPEKWNDVPIVKNRAPYKFNEINHDLENSETSHKLSFLLKKLQKEKIRLFYKELTTVDVKDVGVSVVRVLSPELSLIHGDENIPFLGGRTKDIEWRYKGLKKGVFPNVYPHPLG